MATKGELSSKFYEFRANKGYCWLISHLLIFWWEYCRRFVRVKHEILILPLDGSFSFPCCSASSACDIFYIFTFQIVYGIRPDKVRREFWLSDRMKRLFESFSNIYARFLMIRLKPCGRGWGAWASQIDQRATALYRWKNNGAFFSSYSAAFGIHSKLLNAQYAIVYAWKYR